MKFNKKQKIIAGIIAVSILGGGSYTYKTYKFKKEYKEQHQGLIDIYQIGGKEKIFMNGKIMPTKSKQISVSPEQGELDTIKVSDGQYVDRGDILFTCKNSAQIKEISDLNIQIEIKKKEKKNAIDEESQKAIDSEIKQLNSQVAILNKTAYQSVYAPFSGKVYLNKSINAGGSVLTLDSKELYVIAQVNERDSYRISKDQDVELTSVATKEKYQGVITKIGDRPVGSLGDDQGDSGNMGMSKYEVEINLNKQDNLKHGLNMQIVALYGSDDKKVPNAAIFEENGKAYVYKIIDGIVSKTEVVKGEKQKDFTLIKSGLRENDSIIKDIEGKDIKDGDKINEGRIE